MTAIATPTAPPVAAPALSRDTGFVVASTAVAGRTIKKFFRTPQIAVVGTIQGAMFLLIFRYVFGGAISSGSVAYVDFLVPGFIVTGVLFVGMSTSAGVAEDLEQGLFDRFRSLPISRTAVLTGRVLADTLLLTVNTAVTVAIGFAVGFRVHTDARSAVAAFVLVIVFGMAFDWVFVMIGLFSGSAQAAQGMSLLVFPLTFVSSAYVPVSTLPSWMQPIATYQPVSIASDAVRALTLGPDALGSAASTFSTPALVLGTLAWSVVLVAVFAPLALARYSRR